LRAWSAGFSPLRLWHDAMTTVFFLLYDPRDLAKPYRAVGGETIGAPWRYDLSFATVTAARDQLLVWICSVPKSEFHDLTT
jgi:hypothetical protein